MKQPDFIIGGATRSGINALSQILDRHPQIYIPLRKEHQFFHQEKILKPTLETAKTDFEDAVHEEYKVRIPKTRILHGEQEFDPKRAAAGCPKAKILFSLRNPVDRAYAQFQQALSMRKESVKTFEQAIEEELSGVRTPDNNNKCWLFKNRYRTHIEEWWSYYPREKICILIYEEWSDPNETAFRTLEDFLGLEQNSIPKLPEENMDDPERFLNLRTPKLKKKAELSDETRKQLEDIFSVDKTYISNLLGREIPSWISDGENWDDGFVGLDIFSDKTTL